MIMDVNSFKEYEKIPNPELIDEEDLILVETKDGELKSVSYKDLGLGISKDGIIGETGAQGIQGNSGVAIVEENKEPDVTAKIWIKEGIEAQQDLQNDILSYVHDVFMVGGEDPRFNPEVTERTMIYFQVDDDLPDNNVKFFRVPNDESDMQKQIETLHTRMDKLPEVFVQADENIIDIGDYVSEVDGSRYILPHLILSSDIMNGEIKSVISPKINIVYTQNNGGPFKVYRFYVNDTLIAVSYDEIPTSLILENQHLDQDMVIRVEVEFMEGTITFEDTMPYENIQEGYISEQLTISAGQPYWNFSDTIRNPPTVEYIRNKILSGVNLSVGKSLVIKTANSDNAIIFVYPKSLGECSEINYLGFDPYNKDVFDFLEIDIPTIDNLSVVPYYVYCYIAPIEIGPATFRMKL